MSHGRENAPEAYMQHRECRNMYTKERYRDNANFKVASKARSRLNTALRRYGTSHNGKLKLIGWTVDQLRQYLDSFGCMAVDQHIDHDMPLASFDLTDSEQLGRATHWSNLQPLSAADNHAKGHDEPVDFAWNSDLGRWMWSGDSERENLKLPSANVGEVLEELSDEDELDEYGDDEENKMAKSSKKAKS